MSETPIYTHHTVTELMANLEKENAELRAKLDAWESQAPITRQQIQDALIYGC